MALQKRILVGYGVAFVLMKGQHHDPGREFGARNGACPESYCCYETIPNALRYVSERGHIHIMAKKVGEHVYLSVRDDGPGLPPAYQTKIFQKFVQVKGQKAGRTGGHPLRRDQRRLRKELPSQLSSHI